MVCGRRWAWEQRASPSLTSQTCHLAKWRKSLRQLVSLLAQAAEASHGPGHATLSGVCHGHSRLRMSQGRSLEPFADHKWGAGRYMMLSLNEGIPK